MLPYEKYNMYMRVLICNDAFVLLPHVVLFIGILSILGTERHMSICECNEKMIIDEKRERM